MLLPQPSSNHLTTLNAMLSQVDQNHIYNAAHAEHVGRRRHAEGSRRAAGYSPEQCATFDKERSA